MDYDIPQGNVELMEFSGHGFKSRSGQLSKATSNNPLVVNTIYIYVYMNSVQTF